MTLEDSGTQSATVTTEHTLSTLTTAKTFVAVVDMSNLAAGDAVEIRIKTKCLSGGAEVETYFARYKHAQSTPMKLSVPVPSDISFKLTLKQTVGTGRSFPWKVLSL